MNEGNFLSAFGQKNVRGHVVSSFIVDEIESIWLEYAPESSHIKDQLWVRDKSNSNNWKRVTVRYLSTEWNVESLYKEYSQRYSLTYRPFPFFKALKPAMIRLKPPETCACSLHINWEEIVSAFICNLPEVHHNASHYSDTEIDFQKDFPKSIVCMNCGVLTCNGVGLLRPFDVKDLIPATLKAKWLNRIPKFAFVFYDKLNNNPIEFARSLLCRSVLDSQLWDANQLKCAGFIDGCQHCGLSKLIPLCPFVQSNKASIVEWEMHENVPEKDAEGKIRKYFRPIPKSSSMAALWDTLADWFLTYVQHEFRLLWSRQFERKHLREALLACKRRVLSVQVDWAMNFQWTRMISTQREFFKIMQTMLFTAVCEFADDCQKIKVRRIYKAVIIVVCPPGPKDGKTTTACLNAVIRCMEDNYGGSWDLIIRGTDNCGYQFKFTPAIQAMLSQVREFKKDDCLIVAWFKTPEHGKFEGDGHHGVLKGEVAKERDKDTPLEGSKLYL